MTVTEFHSLNPGDKVKTRHRKGGTTFNPEYVWVTGTVIEKSSFTMRGNGLKQRLKFHARIKIQNRFGQDLLSYQVVQLVKRIK